MNINSLEEVNLDINNTVEIKAVSASCDACHAEISAEEWIGNLNVCPNCNKHKPISLEERLNIIVDRASFSEFNDDLTSLNPILLDGYEDKLQIARTKSNLNEAVVTGSARIETQAVIIGIMSFQFMGGSMGSVVGEKITRAILKAANERIPFLLFTASGGARMQEGIFSLMQMAKTSSALALLDEMKTPFISVLTNPTMGGVTASFAMLGDIILAEPGAIIGFAGPRVIEGTIKEKLPDDFQTAEFQEKKGFVDAVVDRRIIRPTLSYLLKNNQNKLY